MTLLREGFGVRLRVTVDSRHSSQSVCVCVGGEGITAYLVFAAAALPSYNLFAPPSAGDVRMGGEWEGRWEGASGRKEGRKEKDGM
jgi:hypothetical protein